MEVMILEKLGYEINSPSALSFQDRFIKASGGDCTEQYFTEVSFVERKKMFLLLPTTGSESYSQAFLKHFNCNNNSFRYYLS